jgi:hypothetical protein
MIRDPASRRPRADERPDPADQHGTGAVKPTNRAEAVAGRSGRSDDFSRAGGIPTR